MPSLFHSALCLLLAGFGSPLGADVPLAHWSFEGSGTIADDSGSAGAHGTLIGQAQRTQGVLGGGLNFDGIDDYVQIDDSGAGQALDWSGPLTLSVWLYPRALGPNQKLFSKDNVIELELGHAGSNRYSARLNNVRRGRGETELQVERWQQVAMVWDGAEVTYYYNGQPDGQAVFSGPLSSNDLNIGLGARPGGYFNGVLDEIEIFDRALSATEVLALFQAVDSNTDADTEPPMLSLGRPLDVVPAGTTEVELAVTTDEPATCRFDLAAGTPFDQASHAMAFDGSEHVGQLSGLPEHVPQRVFVRCRDEAGNTNSSDYPLSFSVGPPDALVAHWTFDDLSGAVATDSSRYGNDATMVGTVTPIPGLVDGAAFFAHDTSHLKVTDDEPGTSLDITSQLTISAWVRPRILFNERMIVSKDNVFELAIGHAGFGSYNVRLGNLPYGRGDSDVLEDVWQHLAVTWDGEHVRYYYDGRPDGVVPFQGTLPENDRDLGLGARPIHYFWGALDEVRIYNVALDDGEIADLHRQSLPSTPRIQLIQPDGGGIPEAESIEIAWRDSDPDHDASISLYYSPTKDASTGTLIAAGLSEDDITDSWTWDISDLPVGGYYIYATIDDGEHPVQVAFAPTAVRKGIRTIIRERPDPEAAILGLPVTYEARTDPPGYEQYIDWYAGTEGKATGWAEPERGSGPIFTTTWHLKTMHHSLGPIHWFTVHASETGFYGSFDPGEIRQEGGTFKANGLQKNNEWTLVDRIEWVYDQDPEREENTRCLEQHLGNQSKRYVRAGILTCCEPSGGTLKCIQEQTCDYYPGGKGADPHEYHWTNSPSLLQCMPCA